MLTSEGFKHSYSISIRIKNFVKLLLTSGDWNIPEIGTSCIDLTNFGRRQRPVSETLLLNSKQNSG
jgi:hypothetical protein